MCACDMMTQPPKKTILTPTLAAIYVHKQTPTGFQLVNCDVMQLNIVIGTGINLSP